MVRVLLEAGAQDVSDTGDELALAAAVAGGHTRVLRLLLEAGGDAGRALQAASRTGRRFASSVSRIAGCQYPEGRT